MGCTPSDAAAEGAVPHPASLRPKGMVGESDPVNHGSGEDESVAGTLAIRNVEDPGFRFGWEDRVSRIESHLHPLAHRIRHMTSHVSLALAAASLLLLASCTGWQDAKFQSTVAAVAEHRPGAPLDLESKNGAIQVVVDPDATELTIRGEVFATTAERAAAVRVDSEWAGGKLRVRAVWPDGKSFGNERCNIEVVVPHPGPVEARSDNGLIRVRGLRAAAKLETDNGKISVLDHVGDVEATSDNGAITIEGHPTAVRVESDNGAIIVRGASRSVHARSDNGAIAVAMTPDAAGPVDLKSSNGSVRVSAGPGMSGTLEASTSSGQVNVRGVTTEQLRRLGNRRAEIRFSSDGPSSRLRSSNGSVTVTIQKP